MSTTIRQNRRKQNISALSAQPEFPPPLPKRRWDVPSSTAAEFGICARQADDLEDDELCFRGFSYTYDRDTTGDGKALLDTFVCQKCPAIFDSRIGLTNHSKLHGARLPLCCDFCDFSCTNSKTLRHHRRAHGVLPRRRRPPSHKNGETQKMKANVGSISMQEKKIALFGATKPDEEKEEIVDDGTGTDDADAEQFGDPPMLERATLNRAGFEEEEEDEDGEREKNTAEEGKNVQTQQNPTSSASATEPTTTSRRTRNATTTKKEEAKTASVKSRYIGSPGSGQQRGDKFGTVRCPMCPFTTPSRVRLLSHTDGHNRSTGFVCSVCGYKHESVGWLHLHCTLHLRKEGIPFQWPPVYVKRGEAEKEGERHGGQDEHGATGDEPTKIIL